MLVKFTDNIGSADAGPLGLDIAKCLKGATLNVSSEVGEQLLKSRLAIEASQPKTVKGVPNSSRLTAEKSDGHDNSQS